MSRNHIESKLTRNVVGVLALAFALTGCMRRDMTPPPASEFGLGPRASAEGMYRATAEPAESIRVGSLHSWTVRLVDSAGAPVNAARITVDGGMPQHGHGLPTRPRVTRELGDGAYQVDGMRFNMGGWWMVTLRVHGQLGDDMVTFNLDLRP